LYNKITMLFFYMEKKYTVDLPYRPKPVTLRNEGIINSNVIYKLDVDISVLSISLY